MKQLASMLIESSSLLITSDYLVRNLQKKRIVEKVLVTLPERFKSKISSLEESKDLSTISLGELMSVLQAREQRRTLRQDRVTEGAFLYKNNNLEKERSRSTKRI